MVSLAGSLYLLSTAVFSLLAIVIGVRLITLARRTQRVPERSVGLVEVPTFLGYERMSSAAEQITSITMLCTAAFGIATICTYWLTFFPPARYQARFRAPAASETGS